MSLISVMIMYEFVRDHELTGKRIFEAVILFAHLYLKHPNGDHGIDSVVGGNWKQQSRPSAYHSVHSEHLSEPVFRRQRRQWDGAQLKI